MVDMRPCRYNVAALLERHSNALMLLEIIKRQQTVSVGDVNDTSIEESGE